MNASVQMLTAGAVLGVLLAASPAQAEVRTASGLLTALSAAGQFSGAAKTREADDLLRQARKAIKDGQYDEADGLIARAEKLDVKYDSVLARFKDTPEKLRKLLAEEKARSAATPQKPSLKFPPLPGVGAAAEPARKEIPADPTAGRSPENALAALTDDVQAKARQAVDAGRKALAAGNVPEAMAAYQRAIAAPASFAPGEYSPANLAADLQRAGVDPARLAPATRVNPSPFTLTPADAAQAADRLPGMPAANGGPAAPPSSLVAPDLIEVVDPAEEAAARLTPRSGGAFQLPAGAPTGNYPVTNPAGPPRMTVSDDAAGAEPQRLPVVPVPQKAEALRLMAQARMALDKGDLRGAQQLAERAQSLNVPEAAFAQGEARPWQLLLEVDRALQRREGIALVSSERPVENGGGFPVARGVYNPAQDQTRNMPARADGVAGPVQPGSGARFYDEGLRALEQQDRATALARFQQAWRLRDELDPAVQRQLQDKLTFLRAAEPLPAAAPTVEPSPLEEVSSQQDLLRQKLMREIAAEEKAAEQLAQKDPKLALANLKKLRERVAATEVEPAARKQLLTLVDRRVKQLEAYVEQNRSTIENDERNNQIRAELDQKRELTFESQNKLAQLVEKFNKLMDEQRYAEAEVIAKQAREIAPDEPVVQTLVWKSRFVRNYESSRGIEEQKDDGFIRSLESVDESAIPFDDRNPLVFGDVKRWQQLTQTRRSWLERQRGRMSPAEQEIQKSLSKPVEARFENRPLTEVIDALSRMTGVNIYLDPQGLHAEGVTSDTPVNLPLNQPISLRSALNLILEPLHLNYVIQNEVLRVTSQQAKDSNTYAKVYYVADLVTPIPNFVPSYNIGLPGALRESLNALGYGQPARSVVSGPMTLAANEGQTPAANASVLAQMSSANVPGLPGGRSPQPMGAGPGGLGGGVQADFDTLIDLITSTIAPQSWDDVGGPGSIASFDTNLSLVISQTQEVHEQIADLLEQLRRLQDLQVTIEVRFITLSDSFFERIGVDFDFDIDDNTGIPLNQIQNQLPSVVSSQPNGTDTFIDDRGPSIAFGWTPTGPTADLDIPFSQGGFGTSVPQFGSFDVNSAANFGFAILSDIEVFFLVQAAQGDNRTNILQAPKVTLFNGQQAFVSDTSQRPFVTSVVPVVGDFAAAHQPVIVVLSEGTSLSVQAVVSADRRFVRLTMVPFFSQIGDVDTFTFVGRTTTDSGTTVQDPANPDQPQRDNEVRTVEGTTVQLPTFSFTTVATTVSVPDGGTVLLGGIKRLREGRTERGVPLLSKIPYVSRLFRNVGIGRDAQSLMMMVTPRIIIQEEEEEKLGIEAEP